MDEAKAREIHLAPAEKLHDYTHDELAAADRWLRDYSLDRLRRITRGEMRVLRDYAQNMARATYGSVETDEFLNAMGCYPKWLVPRKR